MTAAICCSLGLRAARADDADYIYAVQLSADVQTNPPSIHLSWLPDPFGARSYEIFRKLKGDTAWGSSVALSGNTFDYTDSNVVVGGEYEYQVIEHAVPLEGATHSISYGYIFSGIDAPMIDHRGTLVLIVATNSTAGLDMELARLESDLTGDGWTVLRHDVSSGDSPAAVKSLIVNDYNADPSDVNMVFLFGPVPVFHSGDLNYDGHLARPMPADAYYGDMDGDWSSSPDYLPSDVELMVGRVDLSNMTGDGGDLVWPDETELLRNYLDKDHAWRQKMFTVPRRALMGDLRGEEGGEATAASGWRNFDPLVGHGNTWTASPDPPYGSTNNDWMTNIWATVLGSNSYLIAYGCGAGEPDACSGLGTSDGTFYDIRSRDVYALDLKAPFVMLFGSWFGEWDDTDDLLRSVLCAPTMGLAAWIAGRPHWFIHHLGLGETLGYSTRLTMNNSTLYQNQINALPRSIYVAMMGDPTLRLDPVAPPGTPIANATASGVNMSWAASPDDSLAGYVVYRAPAPAGPFTRLTSAPVVGTTFSDPDVSAGSYTYMVRAVKLQTTPSGTYYNPSQGAFVSTVVSAITPPILVHAERAGDRLTLSWNSLPGLTYHVEARSDWRTGAWSDASSEITASGATTSWNDNNLGASPQRFYRVVSP